MKRKINKIISLTLCWLIISTVVISVNFNNIHGKGHSCSLYLFDPLPNESDPPK